MAGAGSLSLVRFAVFVAKGCVKGQPRPARSTSQALTEVRGDRPLLRTRLGRRRQGAERAEAVGVELAAGQRLQAGRGPASPGKALPNAVLGSAGPRGS